MTWDCRNCGHKHSEESWNATPEPRHCHACGALAVLPSGHPNHAWATRPLAEPEPVPAPTPEPVPEPARINQFNKRYAIGEPAPTPEPKPEPIPENVVADAEGPDTSGLDGLAPAPPPRVIVPETIQVTKQGTVKKKPTRRRK